MRKFSALFAFGVCAALLLPTLPADAFGLRIGPFHLGLPLGWHHRHRHLYMHATPHEMARSEPSRSEGSRSDRAEMRRATAPAALSPALIYPSLALPVIFQNVFWPNASQWPFGYQNIFTTAFAKIPGDQDQRQCQQTFDANAMVNRISNEVSPTPEQMPLLQKLGGALGRASGYLARACPREIPAQPVARLQMMQSQIQALAAAIDIVRQPLADFTQSLTADQQSRFNGLPPTQTTVQEQNQAGNLIHGCGDSATAIDWSIDQINQSVQPTDAQRDDLAEIKRTFNAAASDLDSHCPASAPATALGRLETIQARLDAAWRTVLSMQVALANFETKLSDQQKSRFDTMNLASR